MTITINITRTINITTIILNNSNNNNNNNTNSSNTGPEASGIAGSSTLTSGISVQSMVMLP